MAAECTEDDITCPYCGYAMEDSWECLNADECEVFECDECRKKFRAICEVQVEYTSIPDCSLNDQEHQFESLDRNNDYVICSICQKLKRMCH